MTNMKARLFYMCKVYATFLMFFILQKIIFTYVNAAASAWPLTIGDMAQVIIHGLPFSHSFPCGMGGHVVAAP